MSQNDNADICIEFDDVVAGYKDFMILNNLSFKARKGSITLLLGPNGAGKSTALKALFGLLKLRQGRILLDGENIAGLNQKELGIGRIHAGHENHARTHSRSAGVLPPCERADELNGFCPVGR